MSKKVAVLITDDFEDSEFTSPAEAFRQAGHTLVTIDDKAGKTVHGKKSKASVKIDLGIDDARVEQFDALLLPGGYSPDKLRGDDRFVNFTRTFAESKKPIFAICHGPQLLINAGVLKGRKITTVKPVVVDVKNAGAEYFDKEVVVDGNWVTSRTPDDLPAFNRESVKILGQPSR